MPEPTFDDVDTLIGPATPHFAYQIRERVQRLVVRAARRPSGAEVRGGAPGAARPARVHDIEGGGRRPVRSSARVTRLGRWEWAFAAEAVARGDILLLLDDEAAAAHSADPGDRLWLLPSWRNERPEAVKRSWWAEISRSNRERPADGTVPVRCLCDVVATHPLDDETRGRIAPVPPVEPRARADRTPRAAGARRMHGSPGRSPPSQGDDRYVELAADPPQDGLLPCLTDDAFALHRAVIEHDLEPGHAPRG